MKEMEIISTKTELLSTRPYNHRSVFDLEIPDVLFSRSDWRMEMILVSGDKKLADYTYFPVLPKYRKL